eukprot:SAG31_NODE_917_length_11033_cov_3.285897_5_plen_90_part_00
MKNRESNSPYIFATPLSVLLKNPIRSRPFAATGELPAAAAAAAAAHRDGAARPIERARPAAGDDDRHVHVVSCGPAILKPHARAMAVSS